MFSLAITSCQDYLETVPYSFSSPENFYKTSAEAEIALTGVYNILNARNVQGIGNVSTFARDLPCILNGATDEALTASNYNDPDFAPFGNAGFTADNKLLNNNWFFWYAGINRANYLIDKLGGIHDFSGSRKIEVEAEARFLRGYYHMILSMMHGGIPVYKTPIQSPVQARQSTKEVYELVLADFDFAYKNLPNRAKIVGHVNKWTAAGFLAKAYTYLASSKMSGKNFDDLEINSFGWVDSNIYYTKALDITTDIIANSGYILIPNYDYLFRETTKSDQYKETLLSAEASNSAAMQSINMLVQGFCPQGNTGTFGGSYGFFRPTGEMYNKYILGDKRFKHNLTGNYLNATIGIEVIGNVRYYIPTPLTGSPNTGYYSIGKYRQMDPKQKTIATWASSLNLGLLRYAEILLLHAESQFFTGKTTEARNTISIVRQRAVETGYSLNNLNTAYFKADFIEELLDERSRELCFESCRRFDLARFNKYDTKINGMVANFGYYNPTVVTIKQNWKPERVWFPIPLAQRDINPNLVQNKGY